MNFIDNNGSVFNPTVEAVVWHEMMHLMYGDKNEDDQYNVQYTGAINYWWEDPHLSWLGDESWVDNYDLVGYVVRQEIKVSQELGLAYRPNYSATFGSEDPLGVAGNSFTNGQRIDVVIRAPLNSTAGFYGDLEGRFLPSGAPERQLVFLGGGSDTIRLGAGEDVAYGLAGNDRFYGGEGADILDGGVGRDISSYEGSEAIRIFFAEAGYATGHGGHAEGDRLYDIETIIGGDGTRRRRAGIRSELPGHLDRDL